MISGLEVFVLGVLSSSFVSKLYAFDADQGPFPFILRCIH